MKTIKYLALTLILFMSATVLFADNDGTSIKETTINVVVDDITLIPQIPQIASFDEAGIENNTILMIDLVNRLAPVMPFQADFEDTIEKGVDLSPVVPMEAPYSEFF